MKKIISLLLAIMLVASVAVVSFGAEGTATVTVTSMDGKTETKTFNVGDTFTVYTTLNTSGATGEGTIASVDGWEKYNNSVLEIVDAVDSDGLIQDNDTVFPIARDKAMGNTKPTSGEKDSFYFTMSEASTKKPLVFNADNCKLVVLTYKVIAAGDATVESGIKTLAAPDLYLTRIINKGAVVEGNVVNMHSSFRDPDAKGVDFSVKVTSSNIKADKNVTLALLKGDDHIATGKVEGTTVEYTFEGIEPGEYVLSVSKEKHITRDYAVSVTDDGAVISEDGKAVDAQKLKICPWGDITQDGDTTNFDYTATLQLVRGTRSKDKFTSYQLKCADVFGIEKGKNDGEVQNSDLTRLLQHVRGKTPLFEKEEA